MACERHETVHPTNQTPFCRADVAQEWSFPQGDILMCPFLVLSGVGDHFLLGFFMGTTNVG